MSRKLSSAMTFFTKFVFSGVFLCAALGLFILLWVMPLLAGWNFIWQAALFSLAWGGMAIWCCVRASIPLKVVRVEGRFLRVSNFSKEIVVPLSSVERVEQVQEFRFKLIVLSLKSQTEFGRQIKFMPHTEFNLWREHSVVGELRRLIESQEGSAES